jgi:4-amino-4-deoxy-L-arabinose transferase-like glycosyltransferase
VNERLAHWILTVIVGGYVVLGVAYSLVNPILESPDEVLNYENVRFLVREQSLPVLQPDEVSKAHHPPLYYVLGALVTFWTSDENLQGIVAQVNPFWARELEPGVDNKNLYLHDPTLEGFHDVGLGVLLLRWMSLLMGVGTILCVYGTARELFPRRLSLATGAAALVAFNPMFLFINVSVHDDALANLVTAGVLCVTAMVLVRGATMRRAVLLGLLIGLAILTKLTCLLLMPTVGLALLYRLLVHDRWWYVLKIGAVALLVAFLVGGWWFVRNQLLYGDPTSMNRQLEAWEDRRPGGPDVSVAVRELGFLHDSAWGAFGYGQIPMPTWTYGLTRLLGLAAMGGLAVFFVRRQNGRVPWERPPLVLLVVFSGPLVTALVLFVRMISIDTANFGRYLFVSLAFLAPLYVLGVCEWTRPQIRRWLAGGLAAAVLALALFALFGVLWPAYAPPKMLPLEQIQFDTRPVDVRFGDGIRLVGYSLDRDRVLPGDEVTVTLCWEALAPMHENYAYAVHILGPQESKVGVRDTHPGLGRYPTKRWTVGDAFCDDVRVPVWKETPAPAVYDVIVSWYLYGDEKVKSRLPAFTWEGVPLELVALTKLKVRPQIYAAVQVPERIDADLGGEIVLVGYAVDRLLVDPGDEVSVTLYWAVQHPTSVDYSVFLHLAAPDAAPYAQMDGQPQRGAYPTSWWDEGEIVIDSRMIVVPDDLSPGEYPLVAGMYHLETGVRLPWLAVDGGGLGDAVPVATLTVR